MLVLLALAALAQDASVVEADGRWLIVAVEQAPSPGVHVAVYLAEERVVADRRVVGFRYGGDAEVAWAGGGFAELRLAHDVPVAEDAVVRLGHPRGGPPAVSRPPPAPVAIAPVAEPPAPVAIAPVPPPRSSTPWPFDTDLEGRRLAHDRPSEGRHAVVLRAALTADGTRAPATFEGLAAWRFFPARGPGRVEVGLEALRGARWVKGADPLGDPEEAYGLEPAAGYWLWTRLDSPGVGLAVFGGLGAGVDTEGLSAGVLLGGRTGDPHGSHVELSHETRGGLGWRTALSGQVVLAEPLRAGLRARLGALPRNDPGFRRTRADGALTVSVQARPGLRVSLAGGLAAYDLLLADAGPVLDAALEVSW